MPFTPRHLIRTARSLRYGTRLRRGYLDDHGWTRSWQESHIVDGDGRPVPWFSYPAVDVLAARLVDGVSVFEWGAGGSTIWWATHGGSVVSIEFDRDFHALIAPQVPASVDLRLIPLDTNGDYAHAIDDEGVFDVVVVDGRDRSNCAIAAIDHVAEHGIVIIDNTEHPETDHGCAALVARGYRRLDLPGPASLMADPTTTTIFYRDGNLLGL